jgi:hypothetical protein
LASKARSLPLEYNPYCKTSILNRLKGRLFKGRHLDLPENIRLGCRWWGVRNKLVYSIAVLITGVKSFVVEALEFFIWSRERKRKKGKEFQKNVFKK